MKLVNRPIRQRYSIKCPSLLHRPLPSHEKKGLHMHPLLVSFVVGGATFFGHVQPTVAAFFETTDYNVKSTSLLERVVDTTLHSTAQLSTTTSTTNHHKSSYDAKQYRLPHFSTSLTTHPHVQHPLQHPFSDLHILHANHRHLPHLHQHRKFAVRTKWHAMQKQIPWTAAYHKQHVHKQQHLSVVDTLKAGVPQVILHPDTGGRLYLLPPSLTPTSIPLVDIFSQVPPLPITAIIYPFRLHPPL